MSPDDLPATPDLELLKKRAKELLRAARDGDSAAIARLRAVPRLASVPDVPVAAILADAQHAIAREHGFESWSKLVRRVESEEPLAARAEKFLAAIRDGDPAGARKLLERQPSIARASVFAAAAAGDARHLAAEVARDRALVSAPHEGFTPLLYAAASPLPSDDPRPLRCATILLDAGADPNEATPWEEGGVRTRLTALYRACVGGHARAAKLLLERGAKPNDGESLYHAAQLNRRACVDVLVDHGADPSARSPEFGNTPLGFLAGYHATQPGAEAAGDGILHLLERGADPNVASAPLEETPLHRLAANGWSARIAEALLDRGADPNRPRADGKTPYALAVRAGNEAFAEVLARRGARTDVVAPIDALLGACSRSDEAAARAVLAARPDLLATMTAEDRAAVVHAVHERRVAAVRLLARLGFDLGVEGDWGGTPLHHAAWLGNIEIVRALLEAGAPVDARDSRFGSSPIAWAAHGSTHARAASEDDYLAVARALLDAGAARDASFNKESEPPEALSTRRFAALLRERGFAPPLPDDRKGKPE